MLRTLSCILLTLSLSACVSEPIDPSFIGARAFDADEASKTRVSLGLTYLQNGNFSQAKFNLDKALEFAPRNGQAHYALAFYYQQVDEPELAIESYENALSYSRNDPDVLNSYGAFLCQEGQYEKAKEYFLEAVNDRNYVSTAETYENLAICSQSQGKDQEAINYFNSALNHQPTRPESLFLLTRLYVEDEQWENAKRSLFKYERNAQVSAETLYLQFQIAQGLKDTKTAVGYGEILKSMFPDHPNTQKYLAQMGKFKPSATVTRKIRETSETTESANINTQIVASVLGEPDTSVQVAGSEEQVVNAENAATSAQAEIVETEIVDTEVVENTKELKLSAEEIGYSSVSEITIIDTTKPEDTIEAAAEISEENIEEDAQELADDVSEQAANISDESQVVEAIEDSQAQVVKSDVAANDANDLKIDNALVDTQANQNEIELSNPERVQTTETLVVEEVVAEVGEEERVLDDNADVATEQGTVVVEEQAEVMVIDVTTETSVQEDVSEPEAESNTESETTDSNELPAVAVLEEDSQPSTSDDNESAVEFHTVAAGENLYRISLKYNVKIQSLLKWNDMADASALRTGSQLRVREPNNND